MLGTAAWPLKAAEGGNTRFSVSMDSMVDILVFLLVYVAAARRISGFLIGQPMRAS
jgi:hypothetical protein